MKTALITIAAACAGALAFAVLDRTVLRRPTLPALTAAASVASENDSAQHSAADASTAKADPLRTAAEKTDADAAWIAETATSRPRSASDAQIASAARAIMGQPNNPIHRIKLGDALMQKMRDTGDVSYTIHAERAYSKAWSLTPGSGDAALGLSWVHSVRHEFDKCEEWAKKALERNPQNHLAIGLLGDAALESGRYAAAGEFYDRMIQLRPDLSSYSRAAQWCFLTGNITKANWLMLKASKAGSPFAEHIASTPTATRPSPTLSEPPTSTSACRSCSRG